MFMLRLYYFVIFVAYLCSVVQRYGPGAQLATCLLGHWADKSSLAGASISWVSSSRWSSSLCFRFSSKLAAPLTISVCLFGLQGCRGLDQRSNEPPYGNVLFRAFCCFQVLHSKFAGRFQVLLASHSHHHAAFMMFSRSIWAA